MKTIELSAAIASAPVQENLKNFAGLDAQNALGLMTPERLAAVAGGLRRIGLITNVNADDLKESGFYHLGKGCTPEYKFLIVFNFGNSILQFLTNDSGSGLMSRGFNGIRWSEWSKY